MSLKHVLEVHEVMDSIHVTGDSIKDYLHLINPSANISINRINGEKGYTDFVKIIIPGKSGKHSNGNSPTLGIIGRLGGIGARPEMTGFVSDGDGALAAISIAAKLLHMQLNGDVLDNDVIITTHICPCAPTLPHKPVPFMDSPVDIAEMNKQEVVDEMDAIISIDTTKGNLICNHKGIAISPTVKQGYILKVSDDLLHTYTQVTGIAPVVLAITTQDITPYGNGLYHVNSILQPAVATTCPVVGLAITTETAVAGCATGATDLTDVEKAVRFSIEVAKVFGKENYSFYDENQFQLINKLYGTMEHLQTKGVKIND